MRNKIYVRKEERNVISITFGVTTNKNNGNLLEFMNTLF